MGKGAWWRACAAVRRREVKGMPDFQTLWELLQMYPRDYAEYEPASYDWSEGGLIQGVGTVTSKYVGTICKVGIDVCASPIALFDDGGWNEDGDAAGGAAPATGVLSTVP